MVAEEKRGVRGRGEQGKRKRRVGLEEEESRVEEEESRVDEEYSRVGGRGELG